MTNPPHARQWRHKARGTVYTEVCRGEFTSSYASEPDLLAAYQTLDGVTHVRCVFPVYIELGKEICRGRLQSATRPFIKHTDTLVAYRGSDNAVWFREVTEFEDGRFEEVTQPAFGAMPTPTDPHPWYLGGCDALGPNGTCAECRKVVLFGYSDEELRDEWVRRRGVTLP